MSRRLCSREGQSRQTACGDERPDDGDRPGSRTRASNLAAMPAAMPTPKAERQVGGARLSAGAESPSMFCMYSVRKKNIEQQPAIAMSWVTSAAAEAGHSEDGHRHERVAQPGLVDDEQGQQTPGPTSPSDRTSGAPTPPGAFTNA